jgi:cysteine desulfurase family protein
MDRFIRTVGASPGRSGHQLSIQAARVVYEAREAVSQLLGLNNPHRIIFTSSATEALNLVINGLLNLDDHVITTGIEHNSVMRPLRALENTVTVVPCSKEGFLEPDDIRKAISKNTRLIVMNHASNVVGTILPIAEVGEIAHDYGVLLCVDAAQTAGAFPIGINEAKIDLLAFSGHKSLFGPPGTGGLYIRVGVEQLLQPLIRGGTGSRSEHEYQPDFLPDKYESGTPNTLGLAGLNAGTRFVLSKGVTTLRTKEEKVTQLLISGLESIPKVTIYGSRDAQKQIAVLSFNIAGLTPSNVAMELEQQHGIMCRPGLHCAPIAHKTIGTFPEGTVRLSPGYFNSEEEVNIVIEAISRIAAMSA